MPPLSKAAFMLLNCRCSLHGGSTQCNISIFYPYRGMEDGDKQEESNDCERSFYISSLRVKARSMWMIVFIGLFVIFHRMMRNKE